jgi:hypothetical protein
LLLRFKGNSVADEYIDVKLGAIAINWRKCGDPWKFHKQFANALQDITQFTYSGFYRRGLHQFWKVWLISTKQTFETTEQVVSGSSSSSANLSTTFTVPTTFTRNSNKNESFNEI